MFRCHGSRLFSGSIKPFQLQPSGSFGGCGGKMGNRKNEAKETNAAAFPGKPYKSVFLFHRHGSMLSYPPGLAPLMPTLLLFIPPACGLMEPSLPGELPHCQTGFKGPFTSGANLRPGNEMRWAQFCSRPLRCESQATVQDRCNCSSWCQPPNSSPLPMDLKCSCFEGLMGPFESRDAWLTTFTCMLLHPAIAFTIYWYPHPYPEHRLSRFLQCTGWGSFWEGLLRIDRIWGIHSPGGTKAEGRVLDASRVRLVFPPSL